MVDRKSIFIDYYAYLEPVVKTAYSSQQGIPELHLARADLFSCNGAWALQPGAVYKEAIDNSMTRLSEAGIIHKLRTNAIEEMKKREPRKINGEEIKNIKALAINNVQGVFFVWLVGLGLGIITFITEIVQHVFVTRNK